MPRPSAARELVALERRSIHTGKPTVSETCAGFRGIRRLDCNFRTCLPSIRGAGRLCYNAQRRPQAPASAARPFRTPRGDLMSGAMDLGMVGLGVMGRNFLLNLADHGHGVAGLDKDPAKITALKDEGRGRRVDASTDQTAFLAMLKTPRAIILLVPAGKPVDDVLSGLAPQLTKGDLVIDAGN